MIPVAVLGAGCSAVHDRPRTDLREPASAEARTDNTWPEPTNWLTLELLPASGRGDANTRSQLNAYDALGRLIGTEVGTLMNLSGQWSIDPATRQRTDSWQLDLLGNWVGGAQAGTTGPPYAGREVTDAGGSVTSILHEVNAQNELTGITTTNSSGSTSTQTRYDAVGNLTFDGQYFYQYDAWNRLVQVNRATLDTGGSVVIGVLVKHHTYDGLGRLARTQSPWPDPDTAQAGYLRSERFGFVATARSHGLGVGRIRHG